jgi:hypothetical protein
MRIRVRKVIEQEQESYNYMRRIECYKQKKAIR